MGILSSCLRVLLSCSVIVTYSKNLEIVVSGVSSREKRSFLESLHFTLNTDVVNECQLSIKSEKSQNLFKLFI